MKKALPILIIELVLSFVSGLVFNAGVFNYDFLTTLGLANLIIGLLSFFTGLIIYFVDKEMGKPFLLASGLLLLIGCVTCSIFPLRLNMGR
jgi:drug/metabolite transporter (DMT)-like permease